MMLLQQETGTKQMFNWQCSKVHCASCFQYICIIAATKVLWL
jgi:hypothetical protein